MIFSLNTVPDLQERAQSGTGVPNVPSSSIFRVLSSTATVSDQPVPPCRVLQAVTTSCPSLTILLMQHLPSSS